MKKYLLVYLFIIAFTITMVYVIFQVEYKSQKEILTKKSLALLDEKSSRISDNLASITSDILYLSYSNSIISSFSNTSKEAYKDELLNFLKYKPLYYQLRTIDTQGNEIFRINKLNNNLEIVDDYNLQSKKNRYYVKEAIQLNQNEFYISPLDLNVENQKVEIPYKPTIRVLTPVFDKKGKKKGIVIINVLYEDFLNSLKIHLKKDNAELFIANSDGNWLVAPEDKESWTFMFGKNENQLKNFSQELWKKINKMSEGIFSSKEYLYSYKIINPLKIIYDKNKLSPYKSKVLEKGINDKRLQWHLIIAIPEKTIIQSTWVNINKGIPYLVLGIIILFLLSTYLLRQFEKILIQSEKLKLTANCFTHSDDGMVITDELTRILQVNPRYQVITGYEENELLGKKTKKLSAGDTSQEAYQMMWNIISNTGKWEGEIKDRKKDGSTYIQWLRIIAIKNKLGTIKNYLGVTTDITEKLNSTEKIYQLANKDLITGLPNRKLFQKKLEDILFTAKQTKRSVAVLSIDIDNFKLVNDTLGHLVGDKVLQEIGNRLQSRINEKDIIARFGGDEFFIIMDFTDQHTASSMADNLLKSFKIPFKITENEYYTSASIGIAFYPQDATTGNELIQHADTAMHRAKENAKNSYRHYSSEMNANAHRQLSLEKNLNTAIKNNEFQLFYQPQISLKTKSIVGAEALLRWNNKELGNVSPAEFIPLAEISGHIIPITMWVIEQACIMAKTLKNMNQELSIAINISSVHLKQKNFDTEIYEFITKQGVLPEQIEIEITEGSLIDDIDGTIKKLDNLKKYGFKIAIDDFGTGYSSLSYLKKFGFHKLKIDQAFIRDLPNDEEDVGISRLIIAMSKVLNMKVIAEGAETQENISFLNENNCDMVQGYYFSKPLPAKNFLEFCENYEVTF